MQPGSWANSLSLAGTAYPLAGDPDRGLHAVAPDNGPRTEIHTSLRLSGGQLRGAGWGVRETPALCLHPLLSPPDDEEPQASTDAPPGSDTSCPSMTTSTTGTSRISGRVKAGP